MTDEPRASREHEPSRHKSAAPTTSTVVAPVEREVKFRVSRAFVVPPLGDEQYRDRIGSARRRDICYWDTADLRLARRGHSLRYDETEGSGGTWTLELDGPPSGDVRERREVPCEGVAGAPPSRLADALVAITASRPLVMVARLRCDEQQYAVENDDGETALTIEDDRVAVIDGGDAIGTFREVEVELADGDTEALAAAVQQLRQAGAGEPEPVPRLVRALGPIAERETVPELTRRPTIEQVVRVALLDGLEQLLAHDPAVRLDLDVEDVHRARVAMRRLRANLRTLRPVLDRGLVEALRDEIRWAGAQLGEVRDLDVLHERFADELRKQPSSVSRDLLHVLELERASAHRRLVEAMDSERWQSMIRAVDAAARLPPLRGSVAPTAKARKKVRALLRESWRRLERRAEQAERGEIGFHEVRKAAKSTRYAAELFEPVIGDEADALARATEDIQTELGEQQDRVVACEWLRRHADHVQIGGTADELCASLDRGPVRRPDRWRRMRKKARRAALFVA